MRFRLPLWFTGKSDPQQAGLPLESVEIPLERLIADCSLPRLDAASNSASIIAALAQPLAYPPVVQAILPGDQVTLAIDPETPQVARVVSDVLGFLIQGGILPANLTVLVADRRASRESVFQELPESWRDEIHFVNHDPSDEATHTYLAATRHGQPVYLNRAIGDADVVIPIGVARPDDTLDYRGVHGSWFPTFSNLETQLRYQSPGNMEWQVHQRRRREETEEAAWLLGARLVLQVMPGAAGEVAAAWCGDAEEVARHSSAACSQAWSFAVDRPAELVIAVVEGESSWRHVARALSTASRVVSEGGAIALVTDLAEDPGPALRSLGDFETDEHDQRLSLLKSRSADATAAKVIADCRQSSRVYLHSRLSDALVEEIGLAPLHGPRELQRLIDHADSCLIIGSAQFAAVHVKQPVEA